MRMRSMQEVEWDDTCVQASRRHLGMETCGAGTDPRGCCQQPSGRGVLGDACCARALLPRRRAPLMLMAKPKMALQSMVMSLMGVNHPFQPPGVVLERGVVHVKQGRGGGWVSDGNHHTVHWHASARQQQPG